MTANSPIRVFISYSWDSETHKERVLGLAQRLRDDGLDAVIDRFTPLPLHGWPRWMRDQIEQAQFVLCIVTPTYADRFVGQTAPPLGRGSAWEGSIISGDIYRAVGRNDKFILVIFDPSHAEILPHPLRDYSFFHAQDGYEDLYRILTNQPAVIPAPLGTLRPLPSPVHRGPPLAQPIVHTHRRSRGNLPQLQYFFGRQGDLDAVSAVLSPEARAWIVFIAGAGGIGKTTLAIRAAELVSDDAYSRLVFVSAKSRELEPSGSRVIQEFRTSTYDDLLSVIARELGEDGFHRLEPSRRSVAVQSMLRATPTLLVVDNIEGLDPSDVDRVVEFLRLLPTGSKAIVTGRRRLDVPAEIVRVDPIVWADAEQLLEELARQSPRLRGTTDPERQALHEATGGNPLLLRWVAGQLGLGSCRTVGDALRLLRQSPKGDEALEFIFGDLANSFTEIESRLLAALTFFSEPTPLHHLATIANVHSTSAGAALDSLCDRAFVTAGSGNDLFMLTPLVAPFLLRLRPTVVDETGDLLARHAFTLAEQNGHRFHDRFKSLDTDWPILAAALPTLLQGDNDILQAFCQSITHFLEFTGRWNDWITINVEAEQRAVASEDWAGAGWRAYQSGWALYRFGKSLEMLAAANRALKYWSMLADSEHPTKALRLKGLAYRLQGDPSEARSTLLEALERARVPRLGRPCECLE